MTDCKGNCTCNTTTSAHRIDCLAVGATMPNLMVTADGQAFYADNAVDALAFYNAHGALPASPAAQPELWDLLPPMARAVMDVVAEAASALGVGATAPTTGGPTEEDAYRVPEGCTGYYREDADYGDVLVHPDRCPVHDRGRLDPDTVAGHLAMFGNTAATNPYPADGQVRVAGGGASGPPVQSFAVGYGNGASGPANIPARGTKHWLWQQAENRSISTRELLGHFEWFHLRHDLQEVSRQFGELAVRMVLQLPDSDELRAGLRKLLESKDCMVRCAV